MEVFMESKLPAPVQNPKKLRLSFFSTTACAKSSLHKTALIWGTQEETTFRGIRINKVDNSGG
jgi:hypothetical protein